MSAAETVPDVLGWVTDALQSASSLGYDSAGPAAGHDAPEALFLESVPLLRIIGDFDAMAFVVVEEDGVAFRVAAADPPQRLAEVDSELRHQVASGMFAWSLYQRRPVVVAGEALGRWVVLHVVATPSRVLGMFLGSHRESSAFQSAISQQLLSVVLARMATVLETRQLYGELAAYNARLEALVEERTRDLRRSEEEARAASRAKGDFLANMSHEIRTPIHGILGFTRLLLETDLDPEPREHAEIVLRSADSLLAIVNDLLDYAKVEAGRLDLERAPFDLRQALEDVVELVAPRVCGTSVDLILDYGSDVPREILGDAGRIRQVVLNLVANAVRFTSRGHVLVEVRPGATRGIDISVEDTGVGIPPERVEAMFEKFAQGDAESRRGQGGTGLGLSIARTLARLMDGDVTAVSALGAGSTFTFRLPFADAPSRPGELERTLEGARVAVVADSPRLTGALRRTLERRGAEVVSVEAREVADVLMRQVESPSLSAMLVDGALGPQELLSVARMAGAVMPATPPRLWALLDAGGEKIDGWLARAGYAGWIPKPVREARLLAALRPERAVPRRVPVSTTASFVGVRVLLADDDEVGLRLGVFMLERMGCRVTAVGNGLDAVEAARRHDFDVVILDGAMPGMTGYEAARAMRALEGWEGVPIVALMAAATPEDRARAIEAGMDDHLAKPVSPEVLARVLTHRLSGAPSAARRYPHAASEDELDLEDALRRVGGSREFLDSQFRLFLDGWPRTRQSMLEACHRRDAAELSALAHRLKGGAGSLAANQVYRLAAALESRLATGWGGGGLEAVEALDRAIQRVRVRVDALQRSGEAA
jgi:signal transduction histidine kinase/DNA-binding response OmpR family regulator